MNVAEVHPAWLPPDTLLRAELDALEEDAAPEMTNLPESRTGVPGVVFISTRMGSHGPRVKYFLQAGSGRPSFSVSIEAESKLLANSLDERDLRRAAPLVTAWVSANHEALARFWFEGEGMLADDLIAFLNGLQKL